MLPQGRDAGCTRGPILHLPPASKGSRWTPAHPGRLGLVRALPRLGNTRVVEEGKGRHRADCPPWRVILSSPSRQQDSVLLTQLKSLKQTPAPFLPTEQHQASHWSWIGGSWGKSFDAQDQWFSSRVNLYFYRGEERIEPFISKTHFPTIPLRCGMLAFKKLCWNRITIGFSLLVQNTVRYSVRFSPRAKFNRGTAES